MEVVILSSEIIVGEAQDENAPRNKALEIIRTKIDNLRSISVEGLTSAYENSSDIALALIFFSKNIGIISSDEEQDLINTWRSIRPNSDEIPF